MRSRKASIPLVAAVMFLAVVPMAALSQETPAEGEVRVKPSAVNHDIAGKEACLVCHAIGASPILDVPADHESRPNESCMWCHSSDSPMLSALPSDTPHEQATAETDCMSCHGPEANPEVGAVPESHEGRGNESCMWCHVKVEGGGG